MNEKPGNQKTGRILVVEDDIPNRILLCASLERYEVAYADNGLRALDMMHSRPFDLILLDIIMPELDGFQVLQQMKQSRSLSDIPVVVISALDDMDNIVKCIEMGAEDYLPKPFEPVLLHARIGACLEKKRLRDAMLRQFGKYVPASVATAIIQGQGKLEPRRTTATILFSDIEGFTGISEGMAPEQVFKMLNEYFPVVIEPIMRYGGVVNQFQGDAMLVSFNLPVENPQHAEHAVQAALAMQEAVKGKTFNGLTLRTRIGINTGPVTAGNIGSGERVSYTVYGDAVNVAARLEQLNKQYGTLALVAGSTAELLQERYPLASLGEVPLRGKREPVRLYKLG